MKNKLIYLSIIMFLCIISLNLITALTSQVTPLNLSDTSKLSYPFICNMSTVSPVNVSNISLYIYTPAGVKMQDLTNKSICYQEDFATVTTCGGLNTGSYTYGTGWANRLYVHDNDWNTEGHGGTTPTWQLITYTKPSNLNTAGNLWEVKDGVGRRNLTIPSSCMDYSPTDLNLRLWSGGGGGSAYVSNWTCQSGGSTWVNLWANSNPADSNYIQMYEEAMNWNITYPKDFTTIFGKNNSYEITTFTTEYTAMGNYTWNCYGTATNNTKEFSLNGNYTFNVHDPVYPKWSNVNVTPVSPITYNPLTSIMFNVSWSIASGSFWSFLNFDNIFYNTTNTEANYTRVISNLAVGSYNYYFFSNNSDSWSNQTSNYTFIVNQAPSTTNVLVNPVSPVNYLTQTNFSCNQSQGYIPNMTINNVNKDSERGANITRAGGTYNINCSWNGNQNYTASSENTTYVINKASGNISLKLNSASSNLTVTYPQQTNLTATTLFGTLTLYNQGIDVTTQNGLNVTRSAGYYNISAYSSGNENYSSIWLAYWLNISKANRITNLAYVPANTRTYPQTVAATCSVVPSGSSTDGSLKMWRNNVDVTSEQSIAVILGVGVHTYVCNITEGVNYTTSTSTSTVTINKGVPNGTLTSTKGWIMNESQSVIIGLSESQTGDGDVTYIVYRDGVSKGTGETWSPAKGSYAYILNTTGGANWTVNGSMSTQTLVVNDVTYPLISWGNLVENDGVNKSQTFVYVNISVTETNEANITFNLFNSTKGNINSSFYSTAQRTLNWSSLVNGIYYYNITVCDTTNQCNSTTTRKITLDTLSPNGTLGTPANNTYSNISLNNLTVSLTDNTNGSGIKNATLSVWNNTALVNQTTTTYTGPFTATLGVVVTLIDNAYKWFYNIFDFAGNQYITNNNTLTVDTTRPRIIIVFPVNGSGYTSNSLDLNYTVSDTNMGTCWYSVNGSVTNTTISCSLNVSAQTALQGSNTWMVCTNDSANNQNCSYTTFIIDSVYPTISYASNSDANLSRLNRRYIIVNVTGTDTNLRNVTTRLYNSTRTLINSSVTTTGSNYKNYSVSYDGAFYTNSTACDVSNLCTDLDTRTLYVDATYPSLTVVSPTNVIYKDNYNYTFNLNLSYSDAIGMSTVWYSLNSGTNTTFTTNVTLTALAGRNNITIWANDTTNNINTTTIVFNLTFTPKINNINISNSTTSYSRDINTTNLMGYWKLDKNWSTQDDSSTYSNNGTVLGATFISGKVSGAYDFDGSNDYISIPINTVNVTGMTNFTMSAWFKIPSTWTGANEKAILRKENTFELALMNSSLVRNLVRTSGTTGWTASNDFAYNFTINTWYLMTTVYDGATIKTYINGNLKKSAVATGAFTNEGSGNALSIGSRAGANTFWNGSIDEVIIWNRTISTQEIQQLYYSTNPTFQEYPNVTINATITDEDTPQANLYYSWLVDSVSVLTGFAQNIFNFVFNTRSSIVTLNVNDTNNYIVTQTWNLSETYINPTINFTADTSVSGTVTTNKNITMNITATDANLANLNLYLYDSTKTLFGSITYSTSPRRWVNYGLADGIWYFNATATDIVGNINSTETRNVTIDTTTPNISYVSTTPSNNTYIKVNTFTVNWTGTESNLNTGWVTTDGTNYSATCTGGTASVPTYTCWKVHTAVSAGVHTYTAFVNDTVGYQNNTETRTITYDNANPNATLVSPVTGTVTTQTNFNFTVTALDNYAVKNVTLRIYNTTGLYNITTRNFTSGTFGVNVTLVANKAYNWSYQVTDLAGNDNYTGNFTIIVDTINPNATLNTPSNNTITGTASQNYTVNLTDNIGGVKNATLNIINSTGSTVNQTTITNPSSGVLTQALGIVVSLIDGVFKWFYNVVDFAGNQYTTNQNNTITIDTTNPIVTFESPTEPHEAQRFRTWIVANVSITDLTLASVNFTLRNNGTIINSTTYNSDVRFINWTELPRGIYTYEVIVTDLIGHSTSTGLRTIILDEVYTLNNFRISEINPTNITIKFNPDALVDWVTININSVDGSSSINYFMSDGQQNTTRITGLKENTEYIMSLQPGNSIGNNNWLNFTFRTKGWNPDLSSWLYRRLITIDNNSVVADTNTGALNMTLTTDNFIYYDSLAIARMDLASINTSNGNDFRFVDYYDNQFLSYDITKFDVTNNGTETLQRIPTEVGYSGTFDNSTLCHDGNTGTWCIPNTHGEQWYNYTIPTNAMSSSLFHIQVGDSYDYYWEPVPSSCWNIEGKLQFHTIQEYGSAQSSYCYNSSGSWEQLQGYLVWTSSHAYHESEILWRFPSTVTITVMPTHVDDYTYLQNNGLDKDYPQNIWMYYGYKSAPANETTVSYSTIIDQYTLGSRKEPELLYPIITNLNDTINRTLTGTTITWDVNFATNNTLKYATNPYLLDAVSVVNNLNSAPNFTLTGLNSNLTYYYNAISNSSTGLTDIHSGSFLLGTALTTPTASIITSSYSEDRVNKNITICGNLTNMNGEGNINMSIQYWNEVSTTFNETAKVTKTAVGTFCYNISVDYGHTYYYRTKANGTTIGYSNAYSNDFMAIQDFFVGSYIDDDSDERDRKYCIGGIGGSPCFNQTGVREGSYQDNNWVWVESGLNMGTLTLHWYNSTTWNTYVMNKDVDSAMNYYKLENLTTSWQTMYITNTTAVVANWTKPGLDRDPAGTYYNEVQKYVYFNQAKQAINYQIAYMDYTPLSLGGTGFNYCIEHGGDLYQCMDVTVFGTGGNQFGDPVSVRGTSYDRGEMFAGGVWNGGEWDTGFLTSTPNNREIKSNDTYDGFSKGLLNSSARGCFTFTDYWWQMPYTPSGNITNMYTRFWRNNYVYSDYLGYWQESYLFNDPGGIVDMGYTCIKQFNDTRGDWNSDTIEGGCLPGTQYNASDYIFVTNNTNPAVFQLPYEQDLIVSFQNGFNVETSDAYDLTFSTRAKWGNQLINKYQQGFFIFNLPSNATLQGLDTDSDGLNDYDELFVYYTNPFTIDTDNGGMNDSYELSKGLNPNIYADDVNLILTNPINNTVTPVATQNFTVNISSQIGVENVTLTVNNGDGSLYNQTVINYAGQLLQSILGIPVYLVDGLYTWFYSLLDVAGITTTSPTYNLGIDHNVPFVTLETPVTGLGTTGATHTFNCNITTGVSGSKNLTLYIWNITNGIVNQTTKNVSGQDNSSSLAVTLADGNYIWNCLGWNNANNFAWGQVNYTLFIDNTWPLIEYVNPTLLNNSYIPNNVFVMNLSIDELNLVNATTRLYNSLGYEIWSNTITSNNDYQTISLANDDVYTFSSRTIDIVGNVNTTETRTFTIDRVFPLIDINNDTTIQSGIYGEDSIYWNMSVYDLNINTSTIWLYNSTGLVANSTSILNGEHSFNFTGLVSDTYYINATITDLAGNSNYTETRVIVMDLNAPGIDYVTPTQSNNQYIPSRVIIQNVSVMEQNLVNLTLNWFNNAGVLLNTITTNLSNLYSSFTVSSDGIYKINATACDIYNRCNSTETRTITSDTTIPQVRIISPANNSAYNYTVSWLNYSYSDTNVDTCKYSFNNGITNVTIPSCTNVTGLVSSNGTNTWTLYINDSAGNTNFSRTTFIVEYSPPGSDINTPSNAGSGGGTGYINHSNVNFSFNVYDYKLCYQESANVTNQTGIDGSCGLNYSGKYGISNDYSACTGIIQHLDYAYDGNWSTCLVGSSGYIYTNYSKPAKVYGAIWRVKGGQPSVERNITISSSCYNYANPLQLRVKSYSLGITEYNWYECLNASEWARLGTYSDGATFNEEGIYWLMTNSTYQNESSGLFNATLTITNNQTGNVTNTTTWSFTNLWQSVVSIVISFADGIYDFVITTYDNAQNIFVSDTLKITVDLTNPNITIHSPSEIYSSTLPYYQFLFNYTINDTYLDSCWYTFNNNTIIPLVDCQGTHSFNINATEVDNVITLYANDSAGNNYAKEATFVIMYIRGTYYNNNTYETQSERFTSTLGYNTLIYPNMQAILVYDSTNHTGSIVDNGLNSRNATTVFDIPTVNSSINKTFYWIFIAENLSGGKTTLQTAIYNQTVDNIYLTPCNATYTSLSLNFTTKEEATFFLLNTSLETTLNYWIGGGSTYEVMSFANTSENESNYKFCVSPQLDYKITGIVNYHKTGYGSRDYYFNNATINNVTQNIPLYLLATTSSSIFTFYVQDTSLNLISGAYIYVQRWDIGTGNFYTVSTLKTSNDGKAITNMRLDDAYYRYVVVYNGKTYLTTEPTKESSTGNQYRYLTISLAGDYYWNKFGDISHSLTFNNNTNTFSYIYADTTGATAQGCLRVSEMLANSTSQIYYNCINSVSGTISYSVTTNGTFQAEGIIILNENYSSLTKVVDTLIEDIGGGERFRIIGKFGQVISLVAIGTVAMIGVAIGSIPVGLFLVAAMTFAVNRIGFLNISTSVLYFIIGLCILIGVIGARRRGG